MENSQIWSAQLLSIPAFAHVLTAVQGLARRLLKSASEQTPWTGMRMIWLCISHRMRNCRSWYVLPAVQGLAQAFLQSASEQPHGRGMKIKYIQYTAAM